MNFEAVESSLIELRRAQNWTGAYDLLDPLLSELSGAELGFAKMQLALTVYGQSHGSEAGAVLRINREAIMLCEPGTLWHMKAALNGTTYARDAEDSNSEKWYAHLLIAYETVATAEVVPWHGRIFGTLSYFYERQHNTKKHLAYARKTVSFYAHMAGPFGADDDRKCLVTAHIALADATKATGGKESVIRKYFMQAQELIDVCRNPNMAAFVAGRLSALDGEMASAVQHYQDCVDASTSGAHLLLRLKAQEAIGEFRLAEGHLEWIRAWAPPLVAEAMRLGLTRLAVRFQQFQVGKVGGDFRPWSSDWFCSLSW